MAFCEGLRDREITSDVLFDVGEKRKLNDSKIVAAEQDESGLW
jgi:hypothetical protein